MDTPASPPPSRLRRWLRRGVVLGGLLMLVGLFAPWIAVRVGIVDSALRQATAKLPGRVTYDGISLGWFSGPRVRGLEVHDSDGVRVVRVGEVRVESSLLSLAGNPTDLGTVTVVAPELDLVLTKTGSNLETLLAPYLGGDAAPTKSGASHKPKFALEVTEGIVRVRDADGDAKWKYDRVSLKTAMSDTDPAIPLALSMHEADGATLSVDAKVTRGPLSVTGKASLSRFAVDPIGLVARRFDAGAEVRGTLSGDLEMSATPESKHAILKGHLTGTGVVLHLPKTIADRVALEKIDLPVDLTFHHNRLDIRRLRLESDFGSADVRGPIDLSHNLEDFLTAPGLTASVDIDLAKLARLLPATLAIKPGMSLQSGRIKATLKTTASGNETVIAADLNADDFRARSGGVDLVWKSPLSAEVRVRDSVGQLPTIERLNCRADFLTASATQTSDTMTIVANADLGKLRGHLARFADIGSYALAGDISLTSTVKREADGTQKIAAQIDLKKFAVGLDDKRKLVQDELVIKTNSIAHIESGKPVRLEGSAVTVQSGPDWVWVQLQEPFVPSVKFRVHAKVKAACELARWQPKLNALVPDLAAYAVSGSGEYAARLKYSDGQVELTEMSASPRNLRVVGGGLNIDEPECLLTGSASLQLASGELIVRDISAAMTSATATGKNLLISPRKGGGIPEVRGTVSVRGNLARVQSWFGNPIPGMTGILAASGVFEPEAAGATSLTLTGDIRNFAYRSGDKPVWQEPRVDAVGKLTIPADFAKVTFDDVKLTGNGIGVTGRGSVGLSGTQDLALDGNLDYDLDRLEPQLRGLMGPSFKVDGKDSRPFRISGSLASSKPLGITVGQPVSRTGGGTAPTPATGMNLRANSGLSWQSLSAMGLDFSAAKFDATVTNDLLSTTPIEATVNSGKLRLEPGFNFDTMTATFSPNTNLDRAKITPKMFASAIGYAAPMLANAASAEGELSIRVRNASIPVHDLNGANVMGEIVLHSGKVASGPLLRELATLTRTPGTVELKKESVVKFHLIDGRVHHDRLELVFPDMVIATSGAVGLDGTLQLMVETTIPTKWLEKLPLKGAILQQKIRIPLRGTLSQPKLDEAAIREHLRTLAKAAGQNIIKGELEKFLPK